MRKYNCSLILCVIMMAVSVLSAKTTTISGTWLDTVIVDGQNGKKPFLRITPAAECTLAVSAGCTETVLDKYFVITNAYGDYSVDVNLPEECTYPMYLFGITGSKNGDDNWKYSASMPLDSLKPELVTSLQYVNGDMDTSDVIPGYTVTHSCYVKPIMSGTDSISFYYRLMSNIDGSDTLYFPKDHMFKYRLQTSSGSIVRDTVVPVYNNTDYPIKVFLNRTYVSYYSFCVQIPEDLDKQYSDFAINRRLSLIVTLEGTAVADTVSFQVKDDFIKYEFETGTKKLTKTNSSNSYVSLFSESDKLYVSFAEPGSYSIGLYGVNGRLLKSMALNQKFDAGRNVFDLGCLNAGASNLVIAKVNGRNVSAALMLKKF